MPSPLLAALEQAAVTVAPWVEPYVDTERPDLICLEWWHDRKQIVIFDWARPDRPQLLRVWPDGHQYYDFPDPSAFPEHWKWLWT